MTKISLKITYLKCHSNISGSNEFTISHWAKLAMTLQIISTHSWIRALEFSENFYCIFYYRIIIIEFFMVYHHNMFNDLQR